MILKDQHLLSSVNCWYLLLNQTRRESRDHATLSDIYTNNVIVRLAQISEDVIRLFKKVSETVTSSLLVCTKMFKYRDQKRHKAQFFSFD
ncbi:SLIT-ROBO Rho GTPase-activating protein 3 [Xenoophorus captivus]|uniref:SLIT-ROBO Rho GTPase-activating protein 3 n=1 Tax=Xenoophorus captivus TaxID=1517983 RepID=A0ABV0S6B7_9TELE